MVHTMTEALIKRPPNKPIDLYGDFTVDRGLTIDGHSHSMHYKFAERFVDVDVEHALCGNGTGTVCIVRYENPFVQKCHLHSCCSVSPSPATFG